MPQIENVNVYGLAQSIYRSGYPMRQLAPSRNEFVDEILEIDYCIRENKYDNPHIKRAIKLAKTKDGGHDQFLTGIIVQFDLTTSNKNWTELQRYHFLDFVSSMSTMHRAYAFDFGLVCNKYVSSETIKHVENLQDIYNSIPDEKMADKREAYLNLLYNIPSGFELTAGMTTNYRCIKNMWKQRRKHPLPDWKFICDRIEELPMSKELICV